MQHSRRLVFLILFLVCIGQLAVDLYLPSMPAIVENFQTTSDAVQMTLTVFLFGFAFSQLVYGPLSDAYGRKKLVLSGFFIFTIGGLGCVLSKRIETLLFFRFLQGIGAGGGNVLSMAIMRDVFEKKQLAKMTSYLSMAWAIVPMVAPVIGGYIQLFGDWKVNFYLLSAIGFIGIAVFWAFLPETKPSHTLKRVSLKGVTGEYVSIFLNPAMLGHIFPVMLLFGLFVAFQNTSAFLLQNRMGYSEVEHGWSLLAVSFGYVIGSYLNSRLIERYPERTVMKAGLAALLLLSTFLMGVALLNLYHIWLILVPTFCIFVMTGLVYPNCCTGCLSPFPNSGGTASALFGCMTFLGGGLTSAVISILPSQPLQVLAGMVFIQVVLAAIILQVYFRSTPIQIEKDA